MALGISACPVAKANASPLAQEFIAFLLQPEMQVVLAKSSGSGPVNRKAVLSAEQQKGLPYGDAVAKLLTTDWDTVNANRTAWNNRWTREIER
jgi:putative spermidine/putrescine transport system substrate-binding protein